MLRVAVYNIADSLKKQDRMLLRLLKLMSLSTRTQLTTLYPVTRVSAISSRMAHGW